METKFKVGDLVRVTTSDDRFYHVESSLGLIIEVISSDLYRVLWMKFIVSSYENYNFTIPVYEENEYLELIQSVDS